MLVHICCSVDSHFFLQKLQKVFPNEKLIGYFYDPNIHPYSEYRLRLLDVQRSCEMLGIELIEGKYDLLEWLDRVKGYENEPEKGKRCTICFDNRVENSIKKAKELGERKVTTTLLTSPKKSIEQLKMVGDRLAKKHGIDFVCVDFRRDGGTNEQFALARKDKLYHQNYCGCLYALKKQRDMQKREAVELFCNISNQLQPNSIEEKIELYTKRIELEKEGVDYDIIKESFMNYRLLGSYLKVGKMVLASYPLFYSYLKRKRVKLKIQKRINNLFFSNRENVKLIELSTFNKMMNFSYKDIKEMIKNPPKIEDEVNFRAKIEDIFYSTSPIIIVDRVEFKTFELYLDAIYYQDVRENLVIF